MNSCFAPTENTRGHLRRLSLRPDRRMHRFRSGTARTSASISAMSTPSVT